MDIQKAQYRGPPVFTIAGNRYSIESSSWWHRKINKQTEQMLGTLIAHNKQQKLPKIIRIQKTLAMFGQTRFKQQSMIPSKGTVTCQQKANIYKLGVLTGELKQWDVFDESKTITENYQSLPDFRTEYGIAENNNFVFIFGGKAVISKKQHYYAAQEEQQTKYYNDIYVFIPYSSSWEIHSHSDLPIKGVLPEKRVPLIFTAVGENLLLFGGYNDNQVFQDAFIFIDKCWIQLQVTTKQISKRLSKLKGIGYCLHEDTIYIFGGYDQQRDIFTDQMYRLTVYVENKTVQFIQITMNHVNKQQYKFKKPPCARSHHCLVNINKYYCAVIGGISSKPPQKKKLHQNQHHARYCHLNDIIFYDTKNNLWHRVHPLNGPLALNTTKVSPKIGRNVQAVFMNHSIFIVTNEYQDPASSDQILKKPSLLEIQFNQYQLLRAQVCRNCIKKNQKTSKQNRNDKKSPFLSNGLFYNLALTISFPFQAIGLLADCALQNKATHFSVQICQQKLVKEDRQISKMPYIQIQFNGCGFSKQQLKSLISHTPIQAQSGQISHKLIDRLKLGALRLGKTFLLLTHNHAEQLRTAYLFSADSLITQDYQFLYDFMFYQEHCDEYQSYIVTKQGFYNKKHISKYLEPYQTDTSKILEFSLVNNSSVLFIFQTNTIENVNKLASSQLVASNKIFKKQTMLSEEQQNCLDICQFKDLSKIQFLQKQANITLKNDPQVSLSAYLSVLYTNCRVSEQNPQKCSFEKICVQNTEINTLNNQPYDYLIHSSVQKGKAKIIIDKSFQVNNEISFHFLLCKVNFNEQISKNYGILVYYQNRLINRMQVNFGSLFCSKFSKRKYKIQKLKNVWPYIGIVTVQKGLNLNFKINGFKNDAPTRKFYQFYHRIFKQACTQQSKKKQVIQNIKSNTDYIIINDEINQQQGYEIIPHNKIVQQIVDDEIQNKNQVNRQQNMEDDQKPNKKLEYQILDNLVREPEQSKQDDNKMQ